MRALVISGGGSKGAFAGGVAQYLIQEQGRSYDLLVGTSTGSLLLPHLALGQIDKLHHIYTHIQQSDIFSIHPFRVRKKGDRSYVSINYLTTLYQFLRRRRTFGESHALRRTIEQNFSSQDFDHLKTHGPEIVVTAANLSKYRIEYKALSEYTYQEFMDWIWISANYVPFMSLVQKNGYDYGDGGLGNLIPIQEAIRRGATEIDVVILESEQMNKTKVLGYNPFSLMIHMFGFMVDQIKAHDISEGIVMAKHHGVVLHLYYTPTKLTENALIFDRQQMAQWWEQGRAYAQKKFQNHSSPLKARSTKKEKGKP